MLMLSVNRLLLICVAAAALPAVAAQSQPERGAIAVDIPYTKHVLSNGLTLLVHEDHRTAQVAVNVMYNVGSKDEPVGRSGLAHLFEHLMFGGSEHHRQEWQPTLKRLGATRIDAATNDDQTTFYQRVPTSSLDAVLWLESDRMGYLLGDLDQAKLDKERDVVKNEKRQRENRPHGLAYDHIARAVWPAGHPYAHTSSGSMQDLNSATLDDAREWFRTWYGPSNAIVVLAGDISAALAKEKVERYFGALPPGPAVTRVTEWIAPRRGTQREVIYDSRLGAARLTRVWNMPRMGSADADYLELLATVMADKQVLEAPIAGRREKSARLYRRLVTEERLATNVGVYAWQGSIAGTFTINIDAVPGADLARVEQAVDDELKRLIQEGPNAPELEAIRASAIAGMVQSIQGGAYKAWFLARNEVMLGNAAAWKTSFERLKSAQPEDLKAAARRWLSDGDYILQTLPRGGLSATGRDVDRSQVPEPLPPSAAVPAPMFDRTTLSNGLHVLFAERHDAPEITLQLMIRTGEPADGSQMKPEVGRLAMSLANQGAGQRNAGEFSDALSQLGASLAATADEDFAQVSLTALKPTLSTALELFADVVLRPRFDEAELRQLQAREQTALTTASINPSDAAQRLGNRLLFGADHPYGRLADAQSIASITKSDLRSFHERWIVPERATLIVVGDTTLATLKPQLERLFAGWQRQAGPAVAEVKMPPPTPSAVWLIDAPGAQQSDIQVLLPAAAHAKAQEAATQIVLSILGEDITSRLDLNLREDKHWAYLVRGALSSQSGLRVLRVTAPVQADKTAPAMVELRNELQQIAEQRPVSAAELDTVRKQKTLGLAAAWETHQNVVDALGELVRYSLPDDYLQTYAQRVNDVQLTDARRAAAELLGDRPLTWIVAGDLSKIETQIRALNLGEVKVIDGEGRVLR